MRVLTQLVVVTVIAGAGAGGWYFWEQRGVNKPAAAQAAQGQRGRTAAPVQVEFVVAKLGDVSALVESVGTARANEAVTLTAKQSGLITAIRFEEGQRVKAGQVLIELDNGERKADLDQARAMVEDATQRLQRAKALRSSGTVTEARLDELEMAFKAADARHRMANARLQDLLVTAPFDGKAGLRQVSMGALMQPGATITTIDDVSRIKLEFSIPEVFLGELRSGLPVIGRSPAFPGREFRGEVTAIDSRIDPATRAVRVNAMFDNKDESLKPGLFLNVALTLAQRAQAVLVPEDSILPDGDRQYVFVLGDGRVQRRAVVLGVRRQGEVEVREGVSAGDRVVVRGLQKVRDNQPVTAQPFTPTS